MGFINFIAELLHDPRAAIASWIAAGPLVAYGCVFLIIFIETGVVFFPFLPGDSLLFASGFFAHNGGFNIMALLGIAWAAAILGDQCNFMIGHFFGRKIVASGKEFGTEPHTAGTGPYILTEFDANFVKLKAYDGYWRGAPDIKNVEYRVITENAAAVIAFKNGELDYFTDVPLTDWESVKAASGENNAMLKANDIHWLGINYLSPTNNNILGNEKVREAIFWAINKDDCITAATAGYGSPAYEYMPSEYVATSPNYRDGKFATYDYAPDKAHQCLLDAGFTEEQIASGIDVGTILTYGDASLPKGKECVVIQANLAACGMKAEVETGDYSAVGPRMYSQDYDMAIFADSGNYDYNNIRQQVDSESVGMYVVRFKDDKSPFDWQKMEELVDAGVATADTKERYDIYTELWSMVMDTKTIYPILHTGVGVAWSQNINVPDVPPLYYHIEKMTWAN